MKVMLDTQIYDLIINTPGMTERLTQFSKIRSSFGAKKKAPPQWEEPSIPNYRV